MGTIREDHGPNDSSAIWELLNAMSRGVNPYIRDTGRRQLGGSGGTLYFGTQAWSGSVLLRRVNDLVTLTGRLWVAQGSPLALPGKEFEIAESKLFTLPLGFRPLTAAYTPLVGRITTSSGYASDLYFVQDDYAWVKVFRAPGVTSPTWRQGSFLDMSGTWETGNPFPTTLPGTAF